DVAGFARGRRLLVEVVDPDEAAAVVPVARGFTDDVGLVARGAEGAGRAGDLTTFVLLQRLLADPSVDVPVYAAGGIGPHTAAAAVAGGAAGVVLDVQLALVREADAPAEVAAAVARGVPDADGAVVVQGGRCRSGRTARPPRRSPPGTRPPGELSRRSGTRSARTCGPPSGWSRSLRARAPAAPPTRSCRGR